MPINIARYACSQSFVFPRRLVATHLHFSLETYPKRDSIMEVRGSRPIPGLVTSAAYTTSFALLFVVQVLIRSLLADRSSKTSLSTTSQLGPFDISALIPNLVLHYSSRVYLFICSMFCRPVDLKRHHQPLVSEYRDRFENPWIYIDSIRPVDLRVLSVLVPKIRRAVDLMVSDLPVRRLLDRRFVFFTFVNILSILVFNQGRSAVDIRACFFSCLIKQRFLHRVLGMLVMLMFILINENREWGISVASSNENTRGEIETLLPARTRGLAKKKWLEYGGGYMVVRDDQAKYSSTFEKFNFANGLSWPLQLTADKLFHHSVKNGIGKLAR
ncbi:hypothetical protein LXL04_022216 [Taraxacum kok-saghyz]